MPPHQSVDDGGAALQVGGLLSRGEDAALEADSRCRPELADSCPNALLVRLAVSTLGMEGEGDSSNLPPILFNSSGISFLLTYAQGDRFRYQMCSGAGGQENLHDFVNTGALAEKINQEVPIHLLYLAN